MNKLFEIQTLSDRNFRLKDYGRLADPITVITGIATIIPGLFPNLFGSERNTMEVMEKLFPGNGYWTMKYKNYLLPRIKYIKDIQRDLHMYTGQFIEANLNEICPGCTGTPAWTAFYKLLTEESYGGGIQPPPNIDYSKYLLYGGAAILLIALLGKKKSRKK